MVKAAARELVVLGLAVAYQVTVVEPEPVAGEQVSQDASLLEALQPQETSEAVNPTVPLAAP